MLRRLPLRPIVWSPLLALLAQLVLAGVTGAVTGGGDFPRLR